MCEDYEEGISLENQKAFSQQHSDVTITYDNKHSVHYIITVYYYYYYIITLLYFYYIIIVVGTPT
jgi:hypothetical protein